MNIGEKIKKLRKNKDMNQGELAKVVGVSLDTVSRWETGKRKPRYEDIVALASVFGIPLSELIDEFKENHLSILPDTSSNFLWVPVVEIEACAGNGSEYPDFQMTTTAMHPIMKTELLGHSWQNSGYKIFPISGDSMEPRFSDGDNVLVSIDENLFTGNIVVVWWRGKLYIRGYINHGNKVILKPLNAKYSPIEIEAGDTDLHIIGKVIARVPKIEKVEGIF